MATASRMSTRPSWFASPGRSLRLSPSSALPWMHTPSKIARLKTWPDSVPGRKCFTLRTPIPIEAVHETENNEARAAPCQAQAHLRRLTNPGSNSRLATGSIHHRLRWLDDAVREGSLVQLVRPANGRRVRP
jgi:hypothetical protein